mmetsp:Transcript_30962/g.38291  ORF Transcript_30962/g.38291 Transcript_30962/m.38291 type:complete len:91 (-) Transcript_30962:1789-2061(-)
MPLPKLSRAMDDLLLEVVLVESACRTKHIIRSDLLLELLSLLLNLLLRLLLLLLLDKCCLLGPSFELFSELFLLLLALLLLFHARTTLLH